MPPFCYKDSSSLYCFLFLWNRLPQNWIPFLLSAQDSHEMPFSKCGQIGLSHFKPLLCACHGTDSFLGGTVKRPDRFFRLKGYINRKCLCGCQLKYNRLGMLPAMLVGQWDVSSFCWASKGVWVTDVSVSLQPGVIQCLSKWAKALWFLRTKYTCGPIVFDKPLKIFLCL